MKNSLTTASIFGTISKALSNLYFQDIGVVCTIHSLLEQPSTADFCTKPKVDDKSPLCPPSSEDPKQGKNLLANMSPIPKIAHIVYKMTLNERAPAFTTKPTSGFYEHTWDKDKET